MDEGSGYHDYRTGQAECMCDVASMYSASSALMLMQCDPIFDEEGASGLKFPSSSLALDPARGRVQVQALHYV